MIGAVCKKIAEESYIFHICDGDWRAFISILCIVSLLAIFLYKKKNRKDETIVYLLLLIYGTFIMALGYNITSSLWSVLLLLCTVLMLIKPEKFIDRVVFFIKLIDEKIGLYVRLKTSDELKEIINNNKITIVSIMGIYFAILFTNMAEIFSDCLKQYYTILIIFGAIGLGSYIVFMYEFLSKTKCWLLVLGMDILIGIHVVFTMYDLLNRIVPYDMFVLALIEIIINLFMIGIIGVMLIFEIMNLDGNEKSKYFKVLLYTTLGYSILKSFLEFSFSYYIYCSTIAAVKNVIDSTLQVCFLGSLFAYVGGKLNGISDDDSNNA